EVLLRVPDAVDERDVAVVPEGLEVGHARVEAVRGPAGAARERERGGVGDRDRGAPREVARQRAGHEEARPVEAAVEVDDDEALDGRRAGVGAGQAAAHGAEGGDAGAGERVAEEVATGGDGAAHGGSSGVSGRSTTGAGT